MAEDMVYLVLDRKADAAIIHRIVVNVDQILLADGGAEFIADFLSGYSIS